MVLWVMYSYSSGSELWKLLLQYVALLLSLVFGQGEFWFFFSSKKWNYILASLCSHTANTHSLVYYINKNIREYYKISIFNESEMFYANVSSNANGKVSQKISMQVEDLDQGDHVIDNHDVGAPDTQVLDIDSLAVQHFSPILQPPQESIAVNRPRRNSVRPVRWVEECNVVSYALSCAEEIDCSDEPSTYTEAMVLCDDGKWMIAEMQSLDKNGI
jgi:hypothetical protein